jgi:hypothetical protein
MGSTIETRCKEHMRHTSASQESQWWQNLDFRNTCLVDKALGYMDYLIKEAIKITSLEKLSVDKGFNLIWSCYPVTFMIRQYLDTPVQRQDHAKQTYDSAD